MLSDLLISYEETLNAVKNIARIPDLKENHKEKVIKKMMWHRGRKRR